MVLTASDMLLEVLEKLETANQDDWNLASSYSVLSRPLWLGKTDVFEFFRLEINAV